MSDPEYKPRLGGVIVETVWPRLVYCMVMTMIKCFLEMYVVLQLTEKLSRFVFHE